MINIGSSAFLAHRTHRLWISAAVGFLLTIVAIDLLLMAFAAFAMPSWSERLLIIIGGPIIWVALAYATCKTLENVSEQNRSITEEDLLWFLQFCSSPVGLSLLPRKFDLRTTACHPVQPLSI